VDDIPRELLLSSGEFAARTRLTPKALRIYDRIGLLRPASVDHTNGYRRYSTVQVRTGQLIGLLRSAELPLSDIAAVLDDLASGADAAAARLDALANEMTRRHGDHLLVIRHVQATLKGDDDPMFPIHTRSVPAARVMSIQRRLHASETDRFVQEAKAAFAAHLGATPATGPLILIFHGVVDAEGDGPLEAVLGCPETMVPTEVVGIRTEPAHEEAYTTITKAQWDYPAILAAYDAVACSPEFKSRPGSPLSCREVYLVEPDAIGDDELVCDIAFPLGPFASP
jgi:DNA-binding transcriptional MerR regulator